MRMSRGEMSAARTTIPFSPFRSDLTTSLTPRLRCRDFEAKPRLASQRCTRSRTLARCNRAGRPPESNARESSAQGRGRLDLSLTFLDEFQHMLARLLDREGLRDLAHLTQVVLGVVSGGVRLVLLVLFRLLGFRECVCWICPWLYATFRTRECVGGASDSCRKISRSPAGVSEYCSQFFFSRVVQLRSLALVWHTVRLA